MTVESEQSIQQYREQVWGELIKIARPDSRFHWDFSRFIPDFPGSDRCSDFVMGLDAYAQLGDRQIFVTPDNSTEDLRRRLILDGRPFLMTTYGLRRGFVAVDPADVPSGEARYAATLDGADHYGRALSLSELAAGRPVGMLVTGGSAVSRNGIRFGKGHGYFDFEWALFSELGLVDGGETVIAVMDDCQIIDTDLPGEPHDVVVDWIVTPSRCAGTGRGPRGPGAIRWDLIPGSEFEELDLLDELKEVLDMGQE